MKPLRSFASDNNASVHPEIMQAIAAANVGHTVAYGDDRYTRSALRKIEKEFGAETQAFMVFNGTGANVLSLNALTSSYHAVICAEGAHIYVDECGAPAVSIHWQAGQAVKVRQGDRVSSVLVGRAWIEQETWVAE